MRFCEKRDANRSVQPTKADRVLNSFAISKRCGGRSRARTADLLLVREPATFSSGSFEFKQFVPGESRVKCTKQPVNRVPGRFAGSLGARVRKGGVIWDERVP